MEPTADEMRRAEEWCRGELASSGERPYPINAYAAALAECREAMEFMCALKRRHNGYSRECRDAMPGLKEPSTPDEAITELTEEAAELAESAERERCANIAKGRMEHYFGGMEGADLGDFQICEERYVAAKEIMDAIRGGGA